jgi:hypothetical protein
MHVDLEISIGRQIAGAPIGTDDAIARLRGARRCVQNSEAVWKLPAISEARR